MHYGWSGSAKRLGQLPARRPATPNRPEKIASLGYFRPSKPTHEPLPRLKRPRRPVAYSAKGHWQAECFRTSAGNSGRAWQNFPIGQSLMVGGTIPIQDVLCSSLRHGPGWNRNVGGKHNLISRITCWSGWTGAGQSGFSFHELCWIWKSDELLPLA